jgi:hypothetical protein
MASSHPLPVPCQRFSWLAAALDNRSAPRLALLFFGAVLARGRRTVTTWIRAAKLSGQYQRCYVAVAAAGKRTDRIARRLLTEVVRPLLKDATRLTLGLDDTPTKRYGPHVEGWKGSWKGADPANGGRGQIRMAPGKPMLLASMNLRRAVHHQCFIRAYIISPRSIRFLASGRGIVRRW